MTLRKGLAILLALTLTLSLASCGTATGNTSNSSTTSQSGTSQAVTDGKSDEPVTINFLTWRGDDSAAYDQIVANFNKEYPNITVNFEYVTGTYNQVLTTRLLSNDVDLFALDGRLGPYVENGYLLDLTDYDFMKNYQQGALDSCTIDGRVYGACQMYCMICTFYNVDMLKEHGFEGEPKTWEEFIKICDYFKSIGINPIACGNSVNLSRQLSYQLLVSLDPKNSIDTFANIYNGKSSFTTPPVSTISKLTKQISDAGYYCEGSTGLDKFGACEVFMRGEAPFLVEGSWRAATLSKDPNLNWDLFSVSAPGGAEDTYLLRPGQVHVVNAKSTKLDAAVKFFEFMSKPESMKIFSETTVQVPVGKDVVVDHPALNKVVNYMNTHKAAGDPELHMPSDEVRDLCGDYFMSITLGTPIDKAVANIEQAFANIKAGS